MTLFPLSVLPTSMPRRNALAHSVWPRNVSGRGKPSSSTKISCMLQTRTGMGMRRRPRGGQQRGNRSTPPMQNCAINGRPSRKKKGERVGESGRDEKRGQYRRDDKRTMLVTTDENGKLKMLPLRTWAKQHDEEVDSVANVNPQPPQAQLPLPQTDIPLPPPRQL